MRPSTHYYVLSLSEQHSNLYECFRDTLIDVHNQWFPVTSSTADERHGEIDEISRLRDLLGAVERRFDRYYQEDPLHLIVVGEKRVRTLFESITAHRDAIAGFVDGDHTSTTLQDLGQIVWPIVKEAMTGLRETALRDVGLAAEAQRLIVGLEDVSLHSDVNAGSTLLVEEDYHVRGTFKRLGQTAILSTELDVRETMDDVVDVVIEKVLELGGRVIFMPTGSLKDQDRIALILAGAGDLR